MLTLGFIYKESDYFANCWLFLAMSQHFQISAYTISVLKLKTDEFDENRKQWDVNKNDARSEREEHHRIAYIYPVCFSLESS